jgi:thioredoxin 1
VTVFVGRQENKEEGAAGLVAWRPHEKAAAAARSEGKPVLYDFTAAWCQPCHRLDTEGWEDSGVASLVNGSYLPARVVDREREDGKNTAAITELQRRYSVRAFPTLVVADADGREIAKYEGFPGKERLVQFLQESRDKARAR